MEFKKKYNKKKTEGGNKSLKKRFYNYDIKRNKETKIKKNINKTKRDIKKTIKFNKDLININKIMSILDCSADTAKVLFIENLLSNNIKINNSYNKLLHINNLKNYYNLNRNSIKKNYKKQNYKKQYYKKQYIGGNRKPMDVGGNRKPMDEVTCISEGLCSPDSSSVSRFQAYTIPTFSDSASCNQIGEFHKLSEQNTNQSVGDKNFKPASTPRGASYIEK